METCDGQETKVYPDCCGICVATHVFLIIICFQKSNNTEAVCRTKRPSGQHGELVYASLIKKEMYNYVNEQWNSPCIVYN